MTRLHTDALYCAAFHGLIKDVLTPVSTSGRAEISGYYSTVGEITYLQCTAVRFQTHTLPSSLTEIDVNGSRQDMISPVV